MFKNPLDLELGFIAYLVVSGRVFGFIPTLLVFPVKYKVDFIAGLEPPTTPFRNGYISLGEVTGENRRNNVR